MTVTIAYSTVVAVAPDVELLHTDNHLALLPLPGVKIIFRVGLVLLKCMLGTREKLKACQGQYETMEILRAIEPRYMQEGFLVREVRAEEQQHGIVFQVTCWQAFTLKLFE